MKPTDERELAQVHHLDELARLVTRLSKEDAGAYHLEAWTRTYLRTLSRMTPRVLAAHKGLPPSTEERLVEVTGYDLAGLAENTLEGDREDIPDPATTTNGGDPDA